ncbi:MAG: hypothetical protein HC836_41020 [Richelia sp. RM2_1_2]|nr:hypothetical protein [Richelia sp. RM2_1_2]
MAFEYFLYRTDYNNTLVDRSADSFAPLPPNTGEIFIEFPIPQNQPLYFYKEQSSNIVLNDEETINEYLENTIEVESDSSVTVGMLTGYTANTFGVFVDVDHYNAYTAATDTRIDGIDGDVNYISGQTASKVSNSKFNTYTGNTETTIGGIDDDITYISGQTASKVSNSKFNTYTGTTAPNQFESKTNFNAYTGTTDIRLDNIETDVENLSVLTGLTTGQTISILSVHGDATANITMTNQAAAQQFLANSNRNIYRVEFGSVTQIKLVTRVITASASAASPRIIVKYSPTFTTTVGSYLNIGFGDTEVATSLSSTGVIESSWINIETAAKGNIFLTVTQIGGDGAADPVLGAIDLLIRNTVVTASISLSGVSQTDFNTYTGTTAPATFLSKTDFNSYSGTTLTNINSRLLTSSFNSYSATTQSTINGKVNTLTFTGYTATTNTTINGIEDDVTYLSGQTDTKLDVTDFNSYTGTTETRLDGIEADIIYISGQTGGGSEKLDTSIFTGYTATTETRLDGIEDDIIYLSGETDQRLETSSFNTYSGTTVPATYYNKTQINTYTGATATAIGLKANTNSPTFTGIPAAPTAIANTNTTQLATTAFVVGQASNANPLIDGTVAQGTSLRYSRQDHVHPTDTTRLAVTAFNTYSANTVTYGNNGLTRSGANVRLGGTLTGATTIISPATGSRLSLQDFQFNIQLTYLLILMRDHL